jgi:multidrug efflux pump subunit AcrA (membrane-fusion protein)
VKRRSRALALALLPAAVLAWGASPFLRELLPDEVPVASVRRGPFQRRVVAEGNLVPVEAVSVFAPAGAQGGLNIAWLLPDGSPVAAGDVIMRFDASEMEASLADGRSEKAIVESRVLGKRAESTGAIRNLDRDAGIAQAELHQAREFSRKDPEIFARAEVVQSQIDEDLAAERASHARAQRESKERSSRADLALLDLEERKASSRIDHARNGLAALEVRAPHDGILVYRRRGRHVPKVGDPVWPGTAVAELPRLDAMEARVYVLEADAGGLAVGRPATFVLEARGEREYAARVKSVASLAKPRAAWSPVQYFDVTLGIEHTDPSIMKPGQRVRATLLLDERADALTVPRTALFERDGSSVVYRRRAGGFEPAGVVVGPLAVGRVVVERGLEEGDVVALRDPTRRPEPEREKEP